MAKPPDDAKPPEHFKPTSRLKLVVLAIVAYLVVADVGLQFVAADAPIITGHFPAVIGLPMAAALAFIIVTLLPDSFSPIEFEALGRVVGIIGLASRLVHAPSWACFACHCGRESGK
jgi:hypothetical protein